MRRRRLCALRLMTCNDTYSLYLLLVSDRVVEPRAEKGEEAFFRKIKETFLAIHVEMATKRLHASAGGVPDYVQRYLERFPGYVC